MINSKRKGALGERQWRDKLREEGFDARRGQQYHGGADSPDVICDSMPKLHFEVKYTERLQIYDAVSQAIHDAGDGKMPVVVHRKNNCEWLVLMRADDWFKIVKETNYVQIIFCPDCKKSNVRKNGTNVKRNQQYECLNPECKRSSFVSDCSKNDQ
jgi:Holliday junction resolvase